MKVKENAALEDAQKSRREAHEITVDAQVLAQRLEEWGGGDYHATMVDRISLFRAKRNAQDRVDVLVKEVC